MIVDEAIIEIMSVVNKSMMSYSIEVGVLVKVKNKNNKETK